MISLERQERQEQINFDVADTKRILGSILVYGRFHDENEDGQVRAEIGSLTDFFITPFIDVSTDDRGRANVSRSFRKGDVLAIFNPKGDFSLALVLGTVKNKKDQKDLGVSFPDGASIFYREDSKTFEMKLPNDSSLDIKIGSETIKASKGSIKLASSKGAELELAGSPKLKGGGVELIDILSKVIDALAVGSPVIDSSKGTWTSPISALLQAKADLTKLKG